MRQHTLSKTYTFEGKGLHTGSLSTMTVGPGEVNTGIVFRRTDLGGEIIAAVAENVSTTTRSTTISNGKAELHTVEHILSALTGMGIDNAVIDVNNIEVPILDGSASEYVKAFASDPLVEQDAERNYITISEPIELKDEKTGSWVKIEPADEFSYGIVVDFNSKVLGVQQAAWNADINYAKEIGICRTFVFFHEIEFLFEHNLIKGGDVDNAIVIVEHPVTEDQLKSMSEKIGKPALKVESNGYLNNISLHFENECGRHKLLDLIGDLRLCGGFFKAKITAYKPGHTINTNIAKMYRQKLVK